MDEPVVLTLKKSIGLLNTQLDIDLAKISILEKELELGHHLVPNSFSMRTFIKGSKLDDYSIKGKKYELESRLSASLPF